MTVEFIRNRVVKMRNDYSKNDLNNRLGFNNRNNIVVDDYDGLEELR